MLDLPAATAALGPCSRSSAMAFSPTSGSAGRRPGTSGSRARGPLTLDDVDTTLAAVSDPRDSEGVAEFAAECRRALATLRLRERYLPGVHGRLHERWRAGPDALCGPRGMLAYEALAATLPHPGVSDRRVQARVQRG